MELRMKKAFKGFYLIGLLLLFASLFLEWYYVDISNFDKQIISSWYYNVFTEWSTNFEVQNTVNYLFKPNNLEISLIIILVFIGSLIISLYIITFRDIDTPEDLEKSKNLYYVLFLLLVLNGFFLFVFPVVYLMGGELYFPFMMVKNADLGVIYTYTIGPGYYLQMFGFVLIFPYSIFYYQTVIQFETTKRNPAKVAEDHIERVSEKVDLDRFIAEEKIISRKPAIVNERPISYKKRVKS